MKPLCLLLLSLTMAVRAQSDFHVTAGATNVPEDRPVTELTVVSGTLQFRIRPPNNWTRTVNEPAQKIIFTSPSGVSAITVQFTTNSPGELPEKDVLKAQAKLDHPGAGINSGGVCATSIEPGVFFDLILVPAPQVVQRIRHAFVAEPAGVAEFVLTTTDDEFKQSNPGYMAMLRAFSVSPVKPAKQ